MADENGHALADLLDRAGKVFELAGKLARAFMDESQDNRGHQVDSAWQQHLDDFQALANGILNLRDVIQLPPIGFENVATVLKKAGVTVVQIRDRMETDEGQTWAEYRDYYPALNSVWQNGLLAVKEASKRVQSADPFDFVKERPEVDEKAHLDRMTLDELAAELTRVDQQMNADQKRFGVSGFGFSGPKGSARDEWLKAYNAQYGKRQAIQARIDAIVAREKAELLKSLPPFDTTPLLPAPPSLFVEAAARHIPELLANVPPRTDGIVEIKAATLAEQLQQKGHTLAAAEWAIHRAIRSGELRAALIVWGGVISTGPDGRVRRNEFVTSASRPITPETRMQFDKFNVETTDKLWQRWHEIAKSDVGKPPKGAGQKSDVPSRKVGRPPKDLTNQRATFFEENIELPGPAEIFEKYQQAHPEDLEANPDILRLAHGRVYGPL